jgi:roadblock/LC7 domain-containing protein
VIKKLLVIDGVLAVAAYRDDGAYVEGYGMLPDEQLEQLAHFAHDYKRIVQGNADQLSMFTRLKGWTPPGGWIVHGAAMSVCSVANLVCIVENGGANLSEVMLEMREASSY